MSCETEAFLSLATAKLSRAFVVAYGPERGQEALAEALLVAWERRTEIMAMDNPIGFLYRVGQSKSRRRLPPLSRFPSPAVAGVPEVDPELIRSLAKLTVRQRACVVLVYGYEWTHSEVALTLGISASTVQNHVERGLEKLRTILGVELADDT